MAFEVNACHPLASGNEFPWNPVNIERLPHCVGPYWTNVTLYELLICLMAYSYFAGTTYNNI